MVKPSSPRGWQADSPELDADARPAREPDPQATQKISKEELDAVLKRTKSGTRRAVETLRAAPLRPSGETPGEGSGARPAPTVPREFPVTALPDAAFPGPRDDAPEVSIVRIDSVEMAAIDPASLPAPVEAFPPPTPLSFVPATPPSASRLDAQAPPRSLPRPLPKRRSALEWCGIVIAVAAAMVASFFAGRFTVRLH